jgi:hypothetical protein
MKKLDGVGKHTKTDVVDPEIGSDTVEVVAVGHPCEVSIESPKAATPILIFLPLPNVACHIHDFIGAFSLRVHPNRGGALDTAFLCIGVAGYFLLRILQLAEGKTIIFHAAQVWRKVQC